MNKKEVILDNKFGITDRYKLDEVEFEFVRKRLDELRLKPIVDKFTIKHLKNIHHYIFQDVYPWAGEFREGGYIRKNRVFENGNSHIVEYSYSDYLDYNLKKELDKLSKEKNYTKCTNKEEFCIKLANLYKDLDFLHPFAEGNSRTLREFTRQIGQNAGFDVQWEKTLAIKDELYMARDMGVNNNDSTKLITILNKIVEPIEVKTKAKTKNKDYDR
jgi:cell filamentation protein